jgi:predicted anti-sigma-YlaC factor YlaD
MPTACDRFWEALEGGPSAALEAHAQACPECRALLEALSQEAGSEASPAEAPSSLGAEARAELAAHPTARPWWQGAAALACVWLLVLLAVVRPWTGRVLTPGFGSLGLPLAVALGVAFGGAWLAALSPRRGPAVLGGIVGIGVAVTAMLATCELGSAGWFRGTAHCALTCVLTSALPVGLAVLLLRRFAFSWGRAVAGIAAAGGVGVLMLELVCPSASFAHVAVSHVLPWLVVCAAAIALRRGLRSTSFAP